MPSTDGRWHTDTHAHSTRHTITTPLNKRSLWYLQYTVPYSYSTVASVGARRHPYYCNTYIRTLISAARNPTILICKCLSVSVCVCVSVRSPFVVSIVRLLVPTGRRNMYRTNIWYGQQGAGQAWNAGRPETRSALVINKAKSIIHHAQITVRYSS